MNGFFKRIGALATEVLDGIANAAAQQFDNSPRAAVRHAVALCRIDEGTLHGPHRRQHEAFRSGPGCRRNH